VVLLQLEAEADELRSVVQRKANRPWIWIAMDATTRQVMAFHVGDRRRDSAQELWAQIPVVDREQATGHTDHYDAYPGVIPGARHQAITKQARNTDHSERFNHTLRHRVARLVRETLSFSKQLANHVVPSSSSSATTISRKHQHDLCSTTRCPSHHDVRRGTR
jgi:insertion element IS1 protein InsB